MFDDFNICPYTGLRSFTEEESIYFKGRDEHIQQATAQLEENKFLMLTGASGDGKSSLVYAGIIPNARSGFLKATYSNWNVIDFRPERSPMHNLSEAIARELDIPSVDTVKSSLQLGFSALIDLYKSSKRFTDQSTNEWQQADEEKRKKIGRDGANLIILADQFEEFFTNPENYNKGVPSVESSLVLNLLLETARIALEENLPIYVIFTMRSDYIGQCAAFRGLPEAIGFSQFFVPRMNRRQLQDVIEEPATLSGNTITRRLTERLIHDITDGTDQLPMLQHALNQIWKMADSGKEEMDLIHYAMVGGIAATDLPEEDQQKFIKWFDDLPKKIKICYDESSLQNVLNTHANKLKNHAADYVAEHDDVTLDEKEAKLIIKSTFQCLTKINEGRAVRNRMTLEEITRIINKPNIDTKKVNLVLNVYRDASNTLLKPFIGEEGEDIQIENGTVLDITHESLIRNWSRLEEWAKAELEDYTIFLDFRQQLERWLDNDKSNDYLLSIGPLTYFEAWFKKKEPNKYWIARYKVEDEQKVDKLKQAATVLADSHAFIQSSARKHFITRTVMKYGPKRIAAVLAIIFVLAFSSFTLKNYLDHRDSSMRKYFTGEMVRFANNPEIRSLNISAAVYEQLRLEDITVYSFFSQIKDPKLRTSLQTNLAVNLYGNGAGANLPAIQQLVSASDSLLAVELDKSLEDLDFEYLIRESNDLMSISKMASVKNPEMGYEIPLKNNAKRLAKLIQLIIDNEISDFGGTAELNDAIEYVLNEKAFSNEEIRQVLSKISPFELDYKQNNWLNTIYSKPEIHKLSNIDFGFNFNGLYQELGYLYAASGDLNNALKAIDTLLYYNDNYPNQSYMENIDNALNIGYYFTQYGHPDQLTQFVSEYSAKDNLSKVTYYEKLNARSQIQIVTVQKFSEESVPQFLNKYHNANLDFINASEVSILAQTLRSTIRNSTLTENDKSFSIALSYKNEGLKLARLLEEHGESADTEDINILFEKAIEGFLMLPEEYLAKTTEVSPGVINPITSAPRNYLFLYPDVRNTERTNPVFDFTYTSPAFMEFIISHNYFNKLYNRDNISAIDEWFIEYSARYSIIGWMDVTKLTYQFDKKLMGAILDNNSRSKDQFNTLYLRLGNYATEEEDFGSAITFFDNIEMKQIVDLLSTNMGFLRRYTMRELAWANSAMMRADRIDLANKFIDPFKNPINRSSIYAYAAMEAIRSHGKFPYVDQLIDSALVEMERVENQPFQPNKNLLAAALAYRNNSGDIELARKVIKNEVVKSIGIWWIARGYAFNNQLYNAYSYIPNNLSDDDISGYYYEILHDYNRHNRPESAFWSKYEEIADNSDTRINYIR